MRKAVSPMALRRGEGRNDHPLRAGSAVAIRRVLLSLAILATMLWSPARADRLRFELTPFGGIRLGGSMDVEGEDGDGTLSLDDSPSYGVLLNFGFSSETELEFLWSHEDTQLELRDSGTGLKQTLFDLSVDYYQVGGLYQWDNGRIKPFVAASLGLTRFSPDGSSVSGETQFSGGISAGAKLFLGKHFGFRLQYRLAATFLNSDSDIFCAGAACVGIVRTDWLYEHEFTVGLILAF